MVNDIKDAFIRSRATLVEDVVGAVALMVILMVGLSLPSLV